MSVPDEALAGRIAASHTGSDPTEIRRFVTGSAHYVYDVRFAGRPGLVVRMNMADGRAAMRGAAHLSALLRPAGVPLPELLAADLDGPYPHLLLERLPGTDLAHVAATLSDSQLRAIAGHVAAAHRATARAVTSAGRYGYAVLAQDAPEARWSDVVRASLARSRRRMAAAGLFDPAPLTALGARVEAVAAQLDNQPATPFLHDTTTKNVIIARDGAFSGIVDVDDLCFGDPRYAVALTHAALLNGDGPVAYPDMWLAAAGLAADPLYWLYVASFLVDFMAEHGQVFNGNERPSTPEARARLLALFDEVWPRLAA